MIVRQNAANRSMGNHLFLLAIPILPVLPNTDHIPRAGQHIVHHASDISRQVGDATDNPGGISF
jgi:hypothetical protein